MNANIATLKNSLSRDLKAVQAGEEVVVLDRARPVARIVPFRQVPEPGGPEQGGLASHEDHQLDAMVHRGAITHRGRPADTAAWVSSRQPAKPAAGSPALSDVLLQMRAEEPW